MRFVADRPFADPEFAARKLMEIANSIEPVQGGASTSRRPTGRSCRSSMAVRQNTAPASSSRSSAGGSGCTRAAPM